MNQKKNLRKMKEKGITLVALVVTIVVLLILAGVTIAYVLGDNSIFNQAKNAKEQMSIAKAREKLETVLSEAKILKHTDPQYTQNEYLDEKIRDKITNAKVNGDIAIVDGYAFNLDRSIPWIGEYKGKEEELSFPELSTSIEIAPDKKTATITIVTKTKDEDSGINKIEILQDGIVIKPYSYENEKEEITVSYTVSRNGKYVIKSTAILTATKVENIKDLVSSIEYSPNGSTTWKKEYKVKVTAKESADRVKTIKYQWTNTTAEPGVNTFGKTIENGGTITENTLTGRYYLWTLLEENDGNTRIEKSEAFYFDNTAPTAEIATEWIEEDGKDRLKVSVSNMKDEHSGVNDKSIQLYVTPEKGNKEEKTIKVVNGVGSVIVDGLDIESVTMISFQIHDNAGSVGIIQKRAGRIYLVKNGAVTAKSVISDNTVSYVTSSSNGYVTFRMLCPKNWTWRYTFAGVVVDWFGGQGKLICEWNSAKKNDTLDILHLKLYKNVKKTKLSLEDVLGRDLCGHNLIMDSGRSASAGSFQQVFNADPCEVSFGILKCAGDRDRCFSGYL